MRFYTFAVKIFGGLLKWLYRVEVVGTENDDPAVNYLICANHQALVDPILLATVFPKRTLRFMAKAELMKIPLLKQLITALGAYSVDRGGRDVGAIKKTIELLKDGESIVMFPQGTRRKGIDPKKTSVKFGCAMMALRAKASILPVYIKTENHRVQMFRKTVIHIGKGIDHQTLLSVSDAGKDYHAGAAYIFSSITSLGD